MTEKLYGELASWFHLLTAPADYAEGAAFFRSAMIDASGKPPRTLLELGSGGGNNASHLKAHFEMTLVDISPEMPAVSRALNPECEHVQGDMRSVRLGREDWLRLLVEVGFRPEVFAFEHSQIEPGSQELFRAVKPS